MRVDASKIIKAENFSEQVKNKSVGATVKIAEVVKALLGDIFVRISLI